MSPKLLGLLIVLGPTFYHEEWNTRTTTTTTIIIITIPIIIIRLPLPFLQNTTAWQRTVFYLLGIFYSLEQ